MEEDLSQQAAAALQRNETREPRSGPPQENQEEITPENALVAIAQALLAVEKHLFALVYLEKTRDPAKTGVTYIEDVFAAIYDGSDPFHEIDMVLDELKKKAKKDGDGGQAA